MLRKNTMAERHAQLSAVDAWIEARQTAHPKGRVKQMAILLMLIDVYFGIVNRTLTPAPDDGRGYTGSKRFDR